MKLNDEVANWGLYTVEGFRVKRLQEVAKRLLSDPPLQGDERRELGKAVEAVVRDMFMTANMGEVKDNK